VRQAATRAGGRPDTPQAQAEAAEWAEFARHGGYDEYRNVTLRFGDAARAIIRGVADLGRTAEPPGFQDAFAQLTQTVQGFFAQEVQRIDRLQPATNIGAQVKADIQLMVNAVAALRGPYNAVIQTWSVQTMQAAFEPAKDVGRAQEAAYKNFPHEKDAIAAGDKARDEYLRLEGSQQGPVTGTPQTTQPGATTTPTPVVTQVQTPVSTPVSTVPTSTSVATEPPTPVSTPVSETSASPVSTGEPSAVLTPVSETSASPLSNGAPTTDSTTPVPESSVTEA
jgi:hypothetical protein